MADDEDLMTFCENLGKAPQPVGTKKEAGMPRMFKNTASKWLSRDEFKAWTLEQFGREVDPIIWYTEMGHGPVPADME